jgi:hypothetical protein
MPLKAEERICKKYILGEYIDPQDEYIIDHGMTTVGIIHTGLDVDIDETNEQIGMRRTAKTTRFGINIFNLHLYKRKKLIERWITNKYHKLIILLIYKPD